ITSTSTATLKESEKHQVNTANTGRKREIWWNTCSTRYAGWSEEHQKIQTTLEEDHDPKI
ncbi:unnamed protein product, partial [Tenebrio molitor]